MEETNDLSLFESKLDQLKSDLINLCDESNSSSELLSDDKHLTSDPTEKNNTSGSKDYYNLETDVANLEKNKKRKSTDSDTSSAKKIKSPDEKTFIESDALNQIKRILEDTCDIAMDTTDVDQKSEDDDIQFMEEIKVDKPVLKILKSPTNTDSKGGEDKILSDSVLSESESLKIKCEALKSKIDFKYLQSRLEITKVYKQIDSSSTSKGDDDDDGIQIMEEIFAPKTDDKSVVKEPQNNLFKAPFVNETLDDLIIDSPIGDAESCNKTDKKISTSADDTNSNVAKETNKLDENESFHREKGITLDENVSTILENSSSSENDDIQFMEAVIVTKPKEKLIKSPFVNEELGDDEYLYDLLNDTSPDSPDIAEIIEEIKTDSLTKTISLETSLKMDAVIEDVVSMYDSAKQVSDSPICQYCKQNESGAVKKKTLENSVQESVAIKDENISLISFESCVEAGWPPCFRVTSISIYDEANHMVPYNAGLIEAGMKVFFSGFLLNLVDDDCKIPVDQVGPVLSWRRADWSGNDQVPKLILTTMVENVEVEYHVPMDLVSPEYLAAMDNYKVGTKEKGIQAKKPTSTKSNVTKRLVSPIVRPISPLSITKVSPKPKASTLTPLNTSSSRTQRRSITPFKEYPIAEKPPTSSKAYKKICQLLTSLDGFAGMGKSLVHLIPGYEESADAVACFLLFIHERQIIWRNKFDLKYKKENIPLTNNKVLGTKWFTNMYREVDRGTTYFRNNLLKTVFKNCKLLTEGVVNLNLLQKVLYKSVVYRLMNKLETFEGFGNIPDVKEWSKFSAYATKKMKKEKIFTAAHQNIGLRRYLETMDFVNGNIEAIAKKVAAQAEERSLKGCFKAIHSINNVGPFFAWQILCDLLESRLLGKCTDNQWTMLGPGAKNGLRMIFEHSGNRGELVMTRMLRDLCTTTGPSSGFEALGKRFPALLDQNLSLKNVEHALCEFSKYYKLALGQPGKERFYNVGTSRVRQDKALRCCVCEENSKTKKKFLCVLCNRCFHQGCLDQTKSSPQSHSFLCNECEDNVELWRKEDFYFDEVDIDDGKESKPVFAKKKAPKIPKKRDIECIDLSSDEEEDEYCSDVEDLTDLYFGVEDEDEEEFKTYGESDDNFSNESDIEEIMPIVIEKVWSQDNSGDNAESSGYSSTAEDESKDSPEDPLEVVFIEC